MFNKIEDPAGHLSVRLYAIYKSKEIGSREKFVWLFKRYHEYFTLNIFCTVLYITILYIFTNDLKAFVDNVTDVCVVLGVVYFNLHRNAETLILAMIQWSQCTLWKIISHSFILLFFITNEFNHFLSNWRKNALRGCVILHWAIKFQTFLIFVAFYFMQWDIVNENEDITYRRKYKRHIIN